MNLTKIAGRRGTGGIHSRTKKMCEIKIHRQIVGDAIVRFISAKPSEFLKRLFPHHNNKIRLQSVWAFATLNKSYSYG